MKTQRKDKQIFIDPQYLGSWIKLWRKIQDSQLYKSLNSKQRDVMIQCLLLANHKVKEWAWGKEIYRCNAGQFITSLENLKSKCARDVSLQSVRTSLLILEKWHFLTNISTKTGRLITIVNWQLYQSLIKNQQRNQQTSNKDLTTNKNNKKDKNNIKSTTNKVSTIKKCSTNNNSSGKKKKSSTFSAEKDDFINQIIEIFKTEYENQFNMELINPYCGRNRSAAGNLLRTFKEKHPEYNCKQMLELFQIIFHGIIQVKRKWYRENMSLSLIDSKLNELIKIYQNERSGKDSEVSDREIYEIIAKQSSHK